MMTWTVRQGDALARLREMPDASVQCVVTSPPYWGLRDYGTATWEDEKGDCDHVTARPGAGRADGVVDDRAQRSRDGVGSFGGDCERCGARRIDAQLGLERTPEEYVTKLVEVFREVRRVLRDDGTLWLNMGDSYNTGTTAQSKPAPHTNVGYWQNADKIGRPRMDWPGLKTKDLCGIPWRVAFALQADGWYLRSDIIWSKPNPMPESVTDRPTKAHEYVFMLSKSERYFFDQEAVKEEGSGRTPGNRSYKYDGLPGHETKHGILKQADIPQITRNIRTIWTIATQPFPEAHFATFPEALVEPCIKAGTSERGCCQKCGTAWQRLIARHESLGKKDYEGKHLATDSQAAGRRLLAGMRAAREAGEPHDNPFPGSQTLGWTPSCECHGRFEEIPGAPDWIGPRAQRIFVADREVPAPAPCTVLDPFTGSGTTGVVALKLGRSFVGIELNPKYCEMARRRVGNTAPLFAQEVLP